ncbi:uncharacterized protein DS421_17g597570 [Arachis hypogaea]|nr:uncharacterized protein DS421_17g597570 [Arachis hypogaea]
MDEGLCPLTISPGFDTHWRMGMEFACLGGSPTLCASAVPEGLSASIHTTSLQFTFELK